MNNSDIEHMWKVASNNPNHDTNWHDPDVIAFAKLVAAQEREAWEHKFARLHQLMDIREIQPNKPCCLAARVDEREECIKLVHKGTGEPVQIKTLVILQKERKRIADEIKEKNGA